MSYVPWFDKDKKLSCFRSRTLVPHIQIIYNLCITSRKVKGKEVQIQYLTLNKPLSVLKLCLLTGVSWYHFLVFLFSNVGKSFEIFFTPIHKSGSNLIIIPFMEPCGVIPLTWKLLICVFRVLTLVSLGQIFWFFTQFFFIETNELNYIITSMPFRIPEVFPRLLPSLNRESGGIQVLWTHSTIFMIRFHS